jgi:hypothetical protein
MLAYTLEPSKTETGVFMHKYNFIVDSDHESSNYYGLEGEFLTRTSVELLARFDRPMHM